MGEAVDLPDTYKRCLRLVAEGRTSKEIGQIVGLSDHSVDTYMRHAVRRLGATDRRDAARKFIEMEMSQRLRYQPEAVDIVVEEADQEVVPDQRTEPEPRPTDGMWWRPPPLGGGLNVFSSGRRIVEAARAAVFLVVIGAGFALLFYGALRVLR